MTSFERQDHTWWRRGTVIAGFLIFWQVATLFDTTGMFPTPLQVFDGVITIVTADSFIPAITISTVRVLVAVGIVILVGGVLILIAAYNDYLDILLTDVIFVLIYGISGLLWVFLVLLWLGLSPFAPVLLLALVTSPHFFLNVREGLAAIDTDLVEVGEAFGTRDLAIMRHTVLPQVYPYLVAAIRSMLSVGWRSVIGVEFFAADSGIGYQVHQAFSLFDGVTVAAWAVITLAFLLVSDTLLRLIDTRILRQSGRGDEDRPATGL